MKGNLNIKNNLDNRALPTLWQRFGEDPHTAVMVRSPQAFGPIVYGDSESGIALLLLTY